MGLRLRNPLVCSSSPLCEDVDNLRRMEEAGAAAIVLPSLFEEQLDIESQALYCFVEPLSYLPDMRGYNRGPDGYLDLIQRAKRAVDIPVFASLNGSSPGGWVGFARRIEEAGADAIELNIYWLSTDPALSSQEIEHLYTDLVSEVKAHVRIPVAVKLPPYFTAFASFARQLDEAGADSLVLFNRFYQPDFDLERREVVPTLHPSTPAELLSRLHWTAILFGRIKADLAVTGGVHTHLDVLKVLMAGGRVAMMTSALLMRGLDHLTEVLMGLQEWMGEREYANIDQLIGSMSLLRVTDPATYERANYMKMLRSFPRRQLPV
jgi:dihydroorotate dehydrogenase (fumarate)